MKTEKHYICIEKAYKLVKSTVHIYVKQTHQEQLLLLE